MPRFGLRYKHASPPPPGERQRILDTPGVKLLRDAGSMLSVECDEATATQLAADLSDWIVSPVRQVQLPPSPKKKYSDRLR
jgi:hypothetical protein